MNQLNEAGKPAVLIIDDDLDLLMLLERILDKEGYLVETAAAIPEAEYILSFYKPDLVLLDININGEDGRKLCWKLKKEQQQTRIKVIIMSGYDYSLGRAVLFGADDLLPKPLNIEFLLHKMKHLVSEINSSSTNP
jgi:DNA-binding response OmpR family regulator